MKNKPLVVVRQSILSHLNAAVQQFRAFDFSSSEYYDWRCSSIPSNPLPYLGVVLQEAFSLKDQQELDLNYQMALVARTDVFSRNLQRPLTQELALMLSSIAKAYGCKFVRFPDQSKNLFDLKPEFYLFGSQFNIELTWYLYQVICEVIHKHGRKVWNADYPKSRFAADGQASIVARNFYISWIHRNTSFLQTILSSYDNNKQATLDEYNLVATSLQSIYTPDILFDETPILEKLVFEPGYLDDGSPIDFAVGYKFLRKETHYPNSIHYFSPQRKDEWINGQLSIHPSVSISPTHKKIWLGSGAGIYACKHFSDPVLKDYDDGNNVLVKLHAWGTIIEGDTGWRAQHAKIVCEVGALPL